MFRRVRPPMLATSASSSGSQGMSPPPPVAARAGAGPTTARMASTPKETRSHQRETDEYIREPPVQRARVVPGVARAPRGS
jgi:hypothetical protein